MFRSWNERIFLVEFFSRSFDDTYRGNGRNLDYAYGADTTPHAMHKSSSLARARIGNEMNQTRTREVCVVLAIHRKAQVDRISEDRIESNKSTNDGRRFVHFTEQRLSRYEDRLLRLFPRKEIDIFDQSR